MEVFDYSESVKTFNEFIIGSENKQVSILVHKNVDGDCIGAGLALSRLLQKKSFDTRVISTNIVSENYLWMPNINDVFVFDSIFKDSLVEYIRNSALVFCIDFSQKKRIDENLCSLLENKKICIIDHHLEEPDISGLNIINSSAASTCEILYEVVSLGNKEFLDNDIALCLYTGIVTDTGKFMTQNMHYRVHEIVGEMLKVFDIDVATVNKYIYGSNRFARMRFLGHVLSKCLKIVPGYRVAYISLSHDDTSRFYLKQGETDGLVNYALSIKDVVLAAMFNEKKDGVYLSLRSIGDFAVNEFSKEYFNGGGHKNAAGGFSKLSLGETICNFVDLIKKNDNLKSEYVG